MSIFSRISAVMEANITSAVSKAEDPEKMIDYHYERFAKEVSETKCKTATVMTQEKELAKQLEEAKEKSALLERCAKKAVDCGEDDDARVLLEEQERINKKIVALTETHSIAKENSLEMQARYKSMAAKLDELDSRRMVVKGKVAVAKTQRAMHGVGKNADGKESAIVAFEKMERKADRMAMQSGSMDEIDVATETTRVDDVLSKYTTSATVEERLESLKSEA